MRCTPLFPRGPALTSPGPWHQDCLRSLLLEMTVLRPTSSLRQTRNQSLLRQIPMRHAWQGLPAAGWPTKGTSLSRLASGVLRAASSVPWNGGRQGTADLAALETPEGVGEPPSSATFSGRKRLRETLAGDRCALEHWQG